MSAANRKQPRWSASESNSLELLYTAGWRYDAISAHVSSIHGIYRSPTACRRRVAYIGLSDVSRMSWRRLPDHYNDDLLDMMTLDYSTTQMASSLTQQYGRTFHQAWVHKRLASFRGTSRGSEYAAWRCRISDRQSRGNERGWLKRRLSC